MNVTVIGAGHVGLVTAACLAHVGNLVACLESDSARMELLEQGVTPFHEPDLDELIHSNRAAGSLRLTANEAEAIDHAELVIIATGTPAGKDGRADVLQVLAAARSIGRCMHGYKIVVNKSTAPVGTAKRVRGAIESELAARAEPLEFAVVASPEFLRAGSAVADFLHPQRTVIGLEGRDQDQRAREAVQRLLSPFQRDPDRFLCMDAAAAELAKYAANAMLATRISFMNDLAGFAQTQGIDIEQVREVIGSDPRIGPDFLRAGAGYGGGCIPKDVRALIGAAADAGHRLRVLEAVDAVNDDQLKILLGKIYGRFGSNLEGRTFAVWGLAFKAGTSDMRGAPSKRLVRALLESGARVVAYDPVATPAARLAFTEEFAQHPALLARLSYGNGAMSVIAGADALVVLTEAAEFRDPDLKALKAAMRSPAIFDGRNLYDPAIRADGFEYFAIGR